jgi:hypothetical protein
MSHEVEKIMKETAVVQLKYCSSILPKGLKKTTQKPAGQANTAVIIIRDNILGVILEAFTENC